MVEVRTILINNERLLSKYYFLRVELYLYNGTSKNPICMIHLENNEAEMDDEYTDVKEMVRQKT
jgi:hypothetical protein